MSVCSISSPSINTVLGFIHYNRIAIIAHYMRNASLSELSQQFIIDNQLAFNARYQKRHAYIPPRVDWVRQALPQWCPSIKATIDAAEHIKYNVEQGTSTTICELVIVWCEHLQSLNDDVHHPEGCK